MHVTSLSLSLDFFHCKIEIKGCVSEHDCSGLVMQSHESVREWSDCTDGRDWPAPICAVAAAVDPCLIEEPTLLFRD